MKICVYLFHQFNLRTFEFMRYVRRFQITQVMLRIPCGLE